jgi:hypothetical protein
MYRLESRAREELIKAVHKAINGVASAWKRQVGNCSKTTYILNPEKPPVST